MALKIFAIAIILFLAEIVFLTTKDFKDNNYKKSDIDFTDIAFEDINGYQITKDGVTAKIEASKLLKYSDYAIVIDVKTEFLHQDMKNKISSNEAILKNDTIELFTDVHYENNESTQIFSQNLLYNTKTEILFSKTPFTLTSNQGIVEGDNFIYDQKNGTIKAEKIRYKSREL